MFSTSLLNHRVWADLKVTMVLHMIDEFKFQQAIHEKEEYVPFTT